VADYPFTTLIPNLGVVRKPSGDGTVFADIPGLIEGAHLGAGLGHDFLRHIERTRLLLHLVDITSVDPIADYQTIQQELQAYGRGLPERLQILAINKVDAVDEETASAIAQQLATLSQTSVFLISAVTRRGLDELLQQIWSTLDQLNEQERSGSREQGSGQETEGLAEKEEEKSGTRV
jgi:GTP-binding protein